MSAAGYALHESAIVMMTESARVIAVEQDYLWVEAISRSACGNCQARAGCGQSLLSRWAEKTSYLKVSLGNRDPASFAVNDRVLLGIPEKVIVKSSLMLYCLPLVLLLAGALVGEWTGAGEAASIAGALLGLVSGGLLVKTYSLFAARFSDLQPVILDSTSSEAVEFSRCDVIN